ncbi:hypothetical protein C8R44DRAFT_744441 [Mycena epipterygia]|nr:hypothetical protein C8R44DRAFT_744441 [Mycena epipterygia]
MKPSHFGILALLALKVASALPVKAKVALAGAIVGKHPRKFAIRELSNVASASGISYHIRSVTHGGRGRGHLNGGGEPEWIPFGYAPGALGPDLPGASASTLPTRIGSAIDGCCAPYTAYTCFFGTTPGSSALNIITNSQRVEINPEL